MRILLTGASGEVGAFVVPALAAAGHELVHLARRPAGGAEIAWDLDAPPPPLPQADALAHLAFDHAPGAYRGGEGTDPEGFLRRNRDGSIALIAAARAAGARRILFLSSRAVYGDDRRGEMLRESDPPAPDSLYGVMKRDVEAAVLAEPGGIALRATGVYGRGPGRPGHKWSGLFDDFRAGRPVAPRRATEIHGVDLASAAALLIATPEAAGVYNASDLMLDRRELLGAVRARVGGPPPPDAAPGLPPGEMATDRLRALGWRPGGQARLSAFLDAELGSVRTA